MIADVDEKDRVEGWKEQFREEKREGGVDLRRQNMVRGRNGAEESWCRTTSRLAAAGHVRDHFRISVIR